jgi:hypothetical protein
VGACGGTLRRFGEVGRAGLDSAGLSRATRRLAVVAAEGDRPLAQPGVRGEDTVVAVAVDAGRRDEAGERGEKLEG